ncbi:MAG: S41 family peptidase [bacterium]
MNLKGRIYRRRTRLWTGVPAILLVVLMLSSSAGAQMAMGPDADRDYPIDKKNQLAVIDSVAAALNKIYVFPEMAAEMEKLIRQRYRDGAYKDITSPMEFSIKLTEDLRSICHDRHLGVRWFPPEYFEGFAGDDTLTDAERDHQLLQSQRDNFGFKKLEVKPGNIGYVKFDGFSDTYNAGATAVAAMNFLAHCDAIIFDLRENGGGSPSMIQLLSSYFFDTLTHLNSFYIRREDTTQQFWTTRYVSGPRMAKADLYILTSGYTFSAAEEFTYNFKNLSRATIVGETTGGGAHPVDDVYYPDLMIGVRVPFGRAINPISGTNWEGTGIKPHIEVPADQALDRAYLEALKVQSAGAVDEQHRFGLDWAVAGLEAKLNPITLDPALLASYAGSFGPRTLSFEDGALYYQREDRPKMKMIPMADDLFWFDDVDYFRLQVVVDDDGTPLKLIGHYDNGRTDESERTP